MKRIKFERSQLSNITNLQRKSAISILSTNAGLFYGILSVVTDNSCQMGDRAYAFNGIKDLKDNWYMEHNFHHHPNATYLDNVKFAVNELVAQLSKLAIRQPGVGNQDRILGYGEI